MFVTGSAVFCFSSGRILLSVLHRRSLTENAVVRACIFFAPTLYYKDGNMSFAGNRGREDVR